MFASLVRFLQVFYVEFTDTSAVCIVEIVP